MCRIITQFRLQLSRLLVRKPKSNLIVHVAFIIDILNNRGAWCIVQVVCVVEPTSTTKLISAGRLTECGTIKSFIRTRFLPSYKECSWNHISAVQEFVTIHSAITTYMDEFRILSRIHYLTSFHIEQSFFITWKYTVCVGCKLLPLI